MVSARLRPSTCSQRGWTTVGRTRHRRHGGRVTHRVKSWLLRWKDARVCSDELVKVAVSLDALKGCTLVLKDGIEGRLGATNPRSATCRALVKPILLLQHAFGAHKLAPCAFVVGSSLCSACQSRKHVRLAWTSMSWNESHEPQTTTPSEANLKLRCFAATQRVEDAAGMTAIWVGGSGAGWEV